MAKNKQILSIEIEVDEDYKTNFTYYWINHDKLPTEVIILKQFALHYHKAFGKDLPNSVKIIRVEELLCQEEN